MLHTTTPITPHTNLSDNFRRSFLFFFCLVLFNLFVDFVTACYRLNAFISCGSCEVRTQNSLSFRLLLCGNSCSPSWKDLCALKFRTESHSQSNALHSNVFHRIHHIRTCTRTPDTFDQCTFIFWVLIEKPYRSTKYS